MVKRIRAWMVLLLTGLCCVGFAGYLVVSQQREDHTPPEITVPAEELRVSVGVSAEELLADVTARDDRDGDVTAYLVVEGISPVDANHRAEVTYAAFDRAGNVAKCRRTLYYTDYRAPHFSLSQMLMFRSGRSFDVFDYVSAEDMVDGDLTGRIKATMVDSDTAISAAGVHMVEFRVTNSMGDTAYLTVPVEIYETGEYNAEVELKEILAYVKKGSIFRPDEYLRSLKTSAGETSLRRVPEDVTVQIDSDVDTKTPGCYHVSYTVSSGAFTGRAWLTVVVEG